MYSQYIYNIKIQQMKFTSILKSIILEQSRVEILLNSLTKPSEDKDGKKIKPKLTKSEFAELVKGDPTTKLNNVNIEDANDKDLEKVKAGKYVQWLIKKYLTVKTERQPGERGYEQEVIAAKNLFMENLYKVTDDLKKFDRFKSRLSDNFKDINKLSVEQLYDAVKEFSLEKTKASKEEKITAAETYEHPGGKVVFRGPTWTIIKITDKSQLGKDAACFYGGNHGSPAKGETTWCTSSPGLDWFNRYINKGPLYVVIPNNWSGKRGEISGLPAERYQFHFPDAQFMDVHDHQIDLIDFLNGKMKELKEYFKPEFAKGLTTSGELLQIDGFKHGVIGKFIALYGLEELFDSLPDTLTQIQIYNKDNNNVVLSIPESITRFKDLHMIMLDNCINYIPESICQLSKLRFLAFTNNK